MVTDISHPFGRELSTTEGRIKRFKSWCWRLGFLGVLGFLEYLHSIVAVFELAQLFYLFFLLALVPPLVGAIQYLVTYVQTNRETPADSTDSTEPTSWVESGYDPHPLKRLQSLLMIVHPNVFVRSLLQLVNAVVVLARYRGDPPDAHNYTTDVEYRLPFNGEWTVLNGSPDPSFSHSWFPLQQRYAYDFARTDDEGRTHNGTGGLDSFYCFDEPILAPADGTVVTVKDGHRDYHHTSGWLDPLQYRLVGNVIVIKHNVNEYSLLAHLKQGSIRVSEDEAVEQGEEIGRCGHSGNSTEPHLHFQIQDHPNFYLAMSLPVKFTATTAAPWSEPTVHDQTYVHAGQIVVPGTGKGAHSSFASGSK